MAQKPIPTKEQIISLVAEWQAHGKPNLKTFAALVGFKNSTLHRWFKAYAQLHGVNIHADVKNGVIKTKAKGQVEKAAVIEDVVSQPGSGPTKYELLETENKSLKKQLANVKKETLDEHFVKSVIFKLAEKSPEPPEWLLPSPKKGSIPGVPTLLASDWHGGEVVFPTQIGGVNEYNMTILEERAKAVINNTVYLLKTHMVNPQYPGIVFAIGGDMVTGNIHEELEATNEMEIMPTVLHMADLLAGCIRTLASEFGKVFVPCVSGNHGRNTFKIRNKGRNFTNFDWLIYQILARFFEKDKRITFMIPDGPDANYKIYNHRYLLTHLDQFRGGDSMIGALGPIIRGDHKKRGRNAQIGMSYDTMIGGHWHQLIQLQRLIVNGSLIGYNEYAYNNNFPFEIPRQALWLTHPSRGITFSIPIQVGPQPKVNSEWISWK